MPRGPWTLYIRRADGMVSHVLTTPHQSHAHAEAERILLDLKRRGEHHGITALVLDKDSANQPPYPVPVNGRGIIVPERN